MSRVVLGVGASHSTLMNTHWDEVAGVDRAEAFRAGLAEAAGLVRAANPDVVVIVGSNHFRGFWLDLMPAFTIGVGECVASGESGTPEGPQPVDIDLARHVCRVGSSSTSSTSRSPPSSRSTTGSRTRSSTCSRTWASRSCRSS